MIKGLLTSASKSGVTNTAKSAVKKTAAGGMKKFAKGMTGQTSADYKARVEGKDESGEYLSPEERKARFKGFTLRFYIIYISTCTFFDTYIRVYLMISF